MKKPLDNFYHFMNLANSNAKMGAWSDVGSSMWSIEEHQLSTRKPSGCRFCGGFRGLIGGSYWCLCGFAWFSYGRRLRKCGTKWQEVLAILGLKLKFLLSPCDATPNIQPFQSKCKRLSHVASKFQQPSDLDPRWLTKRRSPCECLHSRGHCPTPCCTSPASMTSGDDGQWGFLEPSNRGLSDSQKTTTPSAPILFNFLSLNFLGICACFSMSSSFQSNFLWGSSSRRSGVSFLRLGRSSAASGPNAQGHSDGSAVDVQDFWGQSRDFSLELASELPS